MTSKTTNKRKTWELKTMAYKINKDKCIRCGACEGACPVGAIFYKDGRYEIDPKKCIECGLCNSICPVEAPNKVDGNEKK